MNNYNNRSMTSNDPRYLQRQSGMHPNYAADSDAEEQMKRRRNQVRDALNRTKDVGKIEKIAEILRV
jgi:hypothetical protein